MRKRSVRMVRWTVVLLACLATVACRGKGEREQPTGEPRAGSTSPFERQAQFPAGDAGSTASAAAEGTDGTATAAATDDGPVEPPAQLAPARPLEARLTLDTGRAVTARVAPEGGTVAAEAADGTKFTLTVPAGALIAPVYVTVTPLAKAEGLLLFHPATLAVEGPAVAEPATGRPRAVAWGGEGRNVHRTPWSVVDGKRVVLLGHFSGYGVGTETDGDAAAERDRMPAGWESQTYARAVELIDRLVERRLSDPSAGAADEDAAALEQLLLDWWNGAVDPGVRELAEHPERLEAFLGDYLPWTSTAEGWGLGPLLGDRRTAAAGPLGDALERESERALGNCDDPEHGAAWAGAALRWAGTAAALGTNDAAGEPAREGDSRLADCLRFTFDMTLTIVVPEEDGVGFRSELSMTGVPLAPAAAAEAAAGVPPIEGEGELKYDSFRASLGGGGCRAVDVRTSPGRARPRLELDVQPRSSAASPDVASNPAGGPPTPVPFAMVTDVCSAPGESYGVRCPGLPRTVSGMAGGTAVAVKEMSVRGSNGDLPGTTRGTMVSNGNLRSVVRFTVLQQGVRIEAAVVHVVQHAPGGS